MASSGRKGSRVLSLDKQETARLFRQYKETGDQEIRDRLITMYLNLVKYLAYRFRNRGEPLEDLIQVGTVGLIKAIDRFDVNRAVEFTTYATPTIVGELKRYFRDKGWAIKVPRRLQELNMQVNQAIEVLSQQMRRSPTVPEIAAHLGASTEEILEALETSEAYNFVSLNRDRSSDSDDSFSLLEYIGQDDKLLANVEDRTSLAAVLQHLNSQEQRILYLRFFRGLTQTEIANELGISQMQVSRLLRRTLDTIRRKMNVEKE